MPYLKVTDLSSQVPRLVEAVSFRKKMAKVVYSELLIYSELPLVILTD